MTIKQVSEALKASAGIQSIAAQKLRVDRSTISRYVSKHPKLRVLIAEITEEMNDLAEGHLLKALQSGQEWAVKYYLKERGQERGYGMRKLAFKDQEGQMFTPAVLVTEPEMTQAEWIAKFGYADEADAVAEPTIQ